MDLSAGLIDDLLLLPQDYRSSSPGGEGNSSEHSREKQREARGQRERERGMEGEREAWGGGSVRKWKERKERAGGRKTGEERGREIERTRRTSWRQEEMFRCVCDIIWKCMEKIEELTKMNIST